MTKTYIVTTRPKFKYRNHYGSSFMVLEADSKADALRIYTTHTKDESGLQSAVFSKPVAEELQWGKEYTL